MKKKKLTIGIRVSQIHCGLFPISLRRHMKSIIRATGVRRIKMPPTIPNHLGSANIDISKIQMIAIQEMKKCNCFILIFLKALKTKHINIDTTLNKGAIL